MYFRRLSPGNHLPPTALVASMILLGLDPSRAALIHEWNFNETSGTVLQDSVGSANANVIVLGGGGYQLTGSAIRLDGGARASADYVSFPSDVFDGMTNVTIEIWAAPHSFQNWGRVLDIGPGDSIPNPTTDNFRLSFSVGLDGNQQWMGLRPTPPVASALLTQTNQLYHYAIVWSATGAVGGGATIQWYRDGAFVTNQDVGTATIANLANLPQTATWLGRSAYTGDSTANASYHAMRIYDEALDAATIALHTLQGPDNDGPDGVDGLIHRWSFSETNGTSLSDSVGSQHGQVIAIPGGGDHALASGQLRLFGGAKATADYAEFPSGLLEGLSSVTIEAWVTPWSGLNWARLFDFGSGVGITQASFFLTLCRGINLNLQRLEFIPYTVDTGLATAVGQQYHYVAVWGATNGTGGGGRMEWYRDGVLAGGVDTGAATVANVDDSVLWLGRSQYPDATADADFSELRIYNRVLTTAEINFNRLLGPNNVSIPPPDAVDDTMILNPGALALIPVLNNDRGSQADPDTLTIVSPPGAGTAQVKPGGRILYAHNDGPATSDQFTYTVQNSLGDTSDVATVFITVSPALRLPNTTITVPDTAPPVAYQVVNAFPGLFFEDAVVIHTPAGRTNQIFVAERRGTISYVPDIHAASPARQVLLDIRDQVQFDNTPQGEMGLLGFSFHPGFATNGFCFVAYTAPGPRQDRLSRFTANPATLTVNTNTQQILFSVVDEVFNHNGSDIHFGPDGYLYMSMGDEGDQYNGRQNAQRIDRDFYSGLLRLDVDKRPGNPEPNPHPAIPTDGSGKAFYSIPVDNPYVHTSLGGSWDGTFFGQTISNLSAVRGEFFATGLRHPWRFSIDPLTGEIWVGDVGQDRYEEVNVVVKGGNYGWAYYEATTLARSLYPNQPNLPTNPPPGLSFPIYHYLHAGQGGDPNFSGDSITGGVVYRGNRLPELNGAYLFADFEFANIWALRRQGTNVTVERLAAQLGIAAFGVDPSNGDVLIANYFDNQVQRLVRTDAVGSSFPPTLSDTGVFADLATLTPNPGIVSYEPKIPFWSDYGIKTRWFTIPDLTNTVGFAQDSNWSLPTGMKWIKHFDLELERGNPASPKRRLETRLLVKTDSGNFGVSYRWNDAQTEAFLVDDDGDTFNVALTVNGTPTNQLWEIPSRAGCLACHSAAGGDALSFNTRELNHGANLNGIVGNQLDVLSQAGYFGGPVPPANILPVYATATDTNASLEFRARSYLAVNCVQCHQAGGTGGGVWDARPHLTLEQTAMLNGPLDLNGGDPANRVVVPGDLAHSVLWRRLHGTNGFSRMPPLATHQIDQTAVQLIGDWITQALPSRLTYAQWIAQYPSLTGPNAQPEADPDGDGASNYIEFLTRTSPDNSLDAWKLGITAGAGLVNVNYQRMPNVGVTIETSADFLNWSPWNVPGNQPFFGSSGGSVLLQRQLSIVPPFQYFRARFVEP